MNKIEPYFHHGTAVCIVLEDDAFFVLGAWPGVVQVTKKADCAVFWAQRTPDPTKICLQKRQICWSKVVKLVLEYATTELLPVTPIPEKMNNRDKGVNVHQGSFSLSWIVKWGLSPLHCLPNKQATSQWFQHTILFSLLVKSPVLFFSFLWQNWCLCTLLFGFIMTWGYWFGDTEALFKSNVLLFGDISCSLP